MPIQQVLDSTIFYREMGAGTPFVFLHGNPASSYLWRNVLPAVGDPARRLAPDLIGMGDSGKPDIDYTFDDHARYLDAWFDALELDSVVLIGHDWGGALAFDWAARHPDRVRGVAFFETIVKPMSWEEFPDDGRRLFEAIKTRGHRRGDAAGTERVHRAAPGHRDHPADRGGPRCLPRTVPDAAEPSAAVAMGAVDAARRRTRRCRGQG